ncbi:hypothetical protein [Saccharothrix obliqua]|uniref:hypothetical protein n=1 Tax=Saccharothrix obliqua TaxID=2861747 RepID=UPI001C5D74CD|nr:hypothetical protein [Saccharothrix obliqua]MBW4720710.1 hypothetical protein [Saccharothrix obliqua]
MTRSSLADVFVVATADPVRLLSLLHRNPFAELAVGVTGAGVVAAVTGGQVLAFTSADVPCVAADGMWCAVVDTLHTWHVAGLDLGLLRRHGLPLWCEHHRGAPSPCGRLDPAQPGGDLLGPP